MKDRGYSLIKNSQMAALSFCHIILLTLSNILVQYPFDIFGFHTTWGAFSYPAIFILTDLTTRLSTPEKARQIIFCSMIPGLVISYTVTAYIEASASQNWSNFFVLQTLPLRIAFASFMAYSIGQIIDIQVFQKYRTKKSWWLAPSLSTTVGNFIDTIIFFSIAFYQSSNPFLSQHWPEIALVDLFFKITISLLAFVPVYGLILNLIHSRHIKFTKVKPYLP